MNLTVYRQSSKVRSDGTVVYKGEDARPYASDQMILVADGLGGASAIRHQNINEDLFCEDKVSNILFEGILDNHESEDISSYVEKSFEELFAVKDCYTDNVYNIKKSGYFASRIVAAIVLHEVMYGDISNKGIFDALAHIGSDQTAQRRYLDDLSDSITLCVRQKLQAAAKKGGLVYESSYSGLALLGTTLCAGLFREEDDRVVVVYFTAGDSRPYTWDPEHGLRQVMMDQEGSDGGMTNYIRANDDADFVIRCDMFEFSKPCVLFNATDGCFDSSAFISPLAFEIMLLNSVLNAESDTELKEKMTVFFEEYGRHDDSSTLAMRTFGFESYTELQKAARSRMQMISREYLEKWPEVLDGDYSLELENLDAEYKREVSTLKSSFDGVPYIREYCIKQLIAGHSQEYNERMESLVALKEQLEKQKLAAENAVRKSVRGSFLSFIPYVSLENTWKERRDVTKLEEMQAKCMEHERRYLEKVKKLSNGIKDASEVVERLFLYLHETGIPEYDFGFDSDELSATKDAMHFFVELLTFQRNLETKSLESLRNLDSEKVKYNDKNTKLATRYQKDVDAICVDLVRGKINISRLRMLAADKKRIERFVSEIRDISEKTMLDISEKEHAIVEECWKKYWEKNYVEIIPSIISDHAASIPEEIKLKSTEVLLMLNKRRKDVKNNADRQSRMFDRYYKGYAELMEDNDADSRI